MPARRFSGAPESGASQFDHRLTGTIDSGAMQPRLTYGTVRETPRTAIYVVRVNEAYIDVEEADTIAARMRERLARRGEIAADVVVVQGYDKNSLRLYGLPYSTNRVRAAMFNAAIQWMPLTLD
jgi:hypothetical protein